MGFALVCCRTVHAWFFFNEDFLKTYKFYWFRENNLYNCIYILKSFFPSHIQVQNEKGWVINSSVRNPLARIELSCWLHELFTDLGCESDTQRFPVLGMRRRGQIYRGICQLSNFWWFCELGPKYLGCELLCSSVGVLPFHSLLRLLVAEPDVAKWSRKQRTPPLEWEYMLICSFLLVLGSSQ